ncbi:MAG: FkbM family methyltransferase [Acidobacteriaceae bacterium]|jgi:FkbM family methyltransferase
MSLKHWVLRSPQLLTSAEFRREQKSKRTWPIFEWAHPHVSLFGVEDEGLTILTFAKDRSVTRSLLATGAFQKEQLLACVALLEKEGCRTGGYFLDVGANIGTHTMYAMQSKAFPRALSIEPEPNNFRLLRANAFLNGWEAEVKAVNAAVGAEEAILSLELCADNVGDHRVRAEGAAVGGDFGAEEERQSISVRVSALDSIIREAGIAVEEISLVWVDTQGFEGFVLQGAKEILGAGVPFHMEIWPHALRRAGSSEVLLSLLEANFTRFYDTASGAAELSQPIAEVRGLFARLGETDSGQTDILAFR